jgi:hypothetical protein
MEIIFDWVRIKLQIFSNLLIKIYDKSLQILFAYYYHYHLVLTITNSIWIHNANILQKNQNYLSYQYYQISNGERTEVRYLSGYIFSQLSHCLTNSSYYFLEIKVFLLYNFLSLFLLSLAYNCFCSWFI